MQADLLGLDSGLAGYPRDATKPLLLLLLLFQCPLETMPVQLLSRLPVKQVLASQALPNPQSSGVPHSFGVPQGPANI